MDQSSDPATRVADVISFLSLLLTGGLFITALAALSAWRAQLLGGRKIRLAEECLHVAHKFAAQIKLLRWAADSDKEEKINALRKTLWRFQRLFLRLNNYMNSPIQDAIPEAFVKCFSDLDTSFRILRRYNYTPPPSAPAGAAQMAAAGAATQREEYEGAYVRFYGDSGDDKTTAGFNQAIGELQQVLRPILRPGRGWLGRMIDFFSSAVEKS